MCIGPDETLRSRRTTWICAFGDTHLLDTWPIRDIHSLNKKNAPHSIRWQQKSRSACKSMKSIKDIRFSLTESNDYSRIYRLTGMASEHRPIWPFSDRIWHKDPFLSSISYYAGSLLLVVSNIQCLWLILQPCTEWKHWFTLIQLSIIAESCS